ILPPARGPASRSPSPNLSFRRLSGGQLTTQPTQPAIAVTDRKSYKPAAARPPCPLSTRGEPMRPLFLIVPLATGSMLPGSPPLATPAAVPEAIYSVQVVLKETATAEPGQPARIRTHANLSVRMDANREARSGSGGRKTVGD